MGAEVISKIAGAGGGIVKTFGSIFGLFFLKWRVTLTILFLLINTSGAVVDSFKERNFYPVLSTIGARLGASDGDLYWRLKEVEDNNWRIPSENIEHDEEGFFRDFKSSLSKINLFLYILFTGWYVYILIYFFYWLMKFHNDSEKLFDLLFALLIVIGIYMLYNVTMLYVNYDCGADNLDSCFPYEDRKAEVLLSLNPLKGTVFLIQNIVNGNLIDAFKESASPIITPINESLNSTNSGVF